MSTSRRRSRRYHHGDLRAAILGAASELLEKEGIAALSVREAARRAGVSHAAPYRHFRDRDALLAALAADGFARLAEALERAGPAGVQARGEAYVRFALAYPQRYRLMFGGLSRAQADAELAAQAARAYRKLLEAFAFVGDERRIAVIACAAWALVHGLSHLLLDGHLRRASGESGNADAFVREVLQAVRFSAQAPGRDGGGKT